MANTLTISAPSGRIWPRKPETSAEGLILSVDFSSSSSTPASANSLYSSANSEILYTSDSRGNITQFLLNQNRFVQPVRKSAQVSHLIVTPENDVLILAQKNKGLDIFGMNGKKIGTFFDHKSEIRGFDINYIRKTLLTYSYDSAVIWDMNNWKKVRTMFARSSSYSMVKFSPDGQSVVTCFGDGTLYQWSLATNDLEKQFAMSNITIFDFSSDKSLVYGISKDLTIKVWRLDHPNKIQFGLSAIPGVKEFKQIECHDNYVVLNANNGRLYFVNPEQNKVEVEFQIGTLFINEFQIAKDKLFLITSNGIVHMYDINVLIQKHNNSANKRLTMGLSEGLVYTLLVRNEYKEAFINPRPESNPPLHSKEDVLFTKLGSGVSLSSSSSASLSEISQCQHELFTSLFQQAKIDPHNSRIQHCQMRRVLHYYGEYPENYRSLIWRFLLQTPGNREAFNGLTSRGTHPNLADLFKNLKEVSHSEFEKTEKVCSALAYWSPFFGDIEYLPKLVHPFGKVFLGDDLSCFEIMASVINHWLQHWFEFYPNSPVVCLQSIDNILQAQAPQLFQSLSQKFGGNLFQITWPLLQTWLSDVTNHEDWAKIVDFLFTDWDKPELTLYLVAMYIMYYKKRLLTLKLRKDVISFFKVKRPLKVKKFMKNVFNLFESAGARTSVVAFNTKLPLSPGQYPLFTGYPKYLVESVDDIADQIRQEQEAKIREKAYVTDIKSRVDNLQEHEDAFQDRTHAVLTAEREKFQRLKLEEKERIEVMKQNDRETREKRLGQIESIEDEGRNYIERQKSRRAALLDKLQSDVEYNQNREAYFQQGLMEEEALNALEYKATQRLLELLKTREAEEAAKKEKIANSSWDREIMLKDRLLQGRWILEDEERKISQVSNKNLALDEKEIIRNQKLQVKSATNRRIEELEREIKILDLEKERRLRQLAEDELHRNEEFKDYYNQNLVLLKKKEVASLSELQHAENQNELKRAEERAEMILNEKKKQLNQRVDQQKALLNIEKENAHREIEERLFTMRKEQEQKAVEDEKRLQEEIITIEEERRAEKQLEQQILFKEKEIREKNIFEKVLHDTEKRLGDSSEYIPQANAKAQDLYRESISRDQAITNKPNYQNMYQNYARSHSSLCSSCHSHNSNSRCTSSEDIPTPPLPVRMTQHFSSESENSDESFNLSQSEGSLGERFVRHTTTAYPSQIDF